MGAVKIRTVMDCLKFDFDVGVECMSCGRLAVYEAGEYGRVMGRALETWGKRFVCTCGSSEVRVKPVHQCDRPKPLPKRRDLMVALYVKRGRRIAGR